MVGFSVPEEPDADRVSVDDVMKQAEHDVYIGELSLDAFHALLDILGAAVLRQGVPEEDMLKTTITREAQRTIMNALRDPKNLQRWKEKKRRG